MTRILKWLSCSAMAACLLATYTIAHATACDTEAAPHTNLLFQYKPSTTAKSIYTYVAIVGYNGNGTIDNSKIKITASGQNAVDVQCSQIKMTDSKISPLIDHIYSCFLPANISSNAEVKVTYDAKIDKDSCQYSTTLQLKKAETLKKSTVDAEKTLQKCIKDFEAASIFMPFICAPLYGAMLIVENIKTETATAATNQTCPDGSTPDAFGECLDADTDEDNDPTDCDEGYFYDGDFEECLPEDEDDSDDEDEDDSEDVVCLSAEILINGACYANTVKKPITPPPFFPPTLPPSTNQNAGTGGGGGCSLMVRP